MPIKFDAAMRSKPMETSPRAVAESPRAAALDLVGMGFSFVCLVHCLALPLLVAILPLTAASLFTDEAFHKWMLLGVIPVSALALGRGVIRRRAWGIAACGLIGVSLIAFAAFSQVLIGWGEAGETALTVSGALILSAAHLLNARASGLLHWHRRGERH